MSALAIDHIEDDGAEHRKKMQKSLTTSFSQIYRDLCKGLDVGSCLQVLCASCNVAKRVSPFCPYTGRDMRVPRTQEELAELKKRLPQIAELRRQAYALAALEKPRENG